MTATGNLFTRSDTLFGVCEGLGQELGINPLWLRLGFALPLIFAPLVVLGLYLGLGATLMALRWRPLRTAAAAAIAAPAAPVAANEDREPALALAA